MRLQGVQGYTSGIQGQKQTWTSLEMQVPTISPWISLKRLHIVIYISL